MRHFSNNAKNRSSAKLADIKANDISLRNASNIIINKTSVSKNINKSESKRAVNELIANNETNKNSRSDLSLNRMQSIGKIMYESEDFGIKLNNTGVNGISSDDEIECIDSFNAGPSGLNGDKQTLESIAVCDLNPSLNIDSNDIKIDEIVFDNEIEINSKPNNETITIDDLEDNESNDNENDVQIIQVKFYSEPIELDDDIEVLSEILNPTEVIDLMKNHLRIVQQLTKLSFTTMRVIMSKYNWNKDHFVSDFYEYGIDRVLTALKLVISNELRDNAKKRKPQVQSEGLETCIVCFDETNKSEMLGSTCNHYLCIECWNNYISTKVNDSTSDEKMVCPSDSCQLIIEDQQLIDIIQDQHIRDKYQRLITNSFVTNNTCLRWCPNGSCLHAVRVKYSGFQDIECVCKTVFCFLCGEQWHEPLSCDMYKNWIQKYASHTMDPNSANWLLKHTKCCPKCKFPIEKNGGCNYVMCAKCTFSFCYYCLGKCSHGRCVGANRPDAVEARTEDLRLKQDLQLYPFYKDSYQNQSKQLTLERKLQEGVCTKLEKAVKSPEFKSALKFLKNAFGVLCHCRQTLMYSYVFGYYLAGPQSEIQVYIDNLAELEKETISLSTILTRETTVIHKDSVIEMKKTVQSSYRKCQIKRSTLVQHIKHGLTAQFWQFINA